MPSAGLDYSKVENIFSPVSAAYASMRLSEGRAQNYVGVLEIVSDDDADKGSTEADGPTVAELDHFTYGPDNNNIEQMWNLKSMDGWLMAFNSFQKMDCLKWFL